MLLLRKISIGRIKKYGLVHISEMSEKFIANPLQVVSVGDVVKVKVIGTDKEKQQVILQLHLRRWKAKFC